MFLNMLRKKRQTKTTLVTQKILENLLAEQTTVILNAVDERFAKMEERFNRKIDRLTATLDKFLKRMTDIEEEFTFLKADLRRIKTVIKEKLGVDLL